MAKQTKKQAGIAALEQRIRDIVMPDVVFDKDALSQYATALQWHTVIHRVVTTLASTVEQRESCFEACCLRLWDNPTTIATRLYEAGVRA